jgi:hypothetical protein
MTTRVRGRRLAAVTLAGLVLAGCSGDSRRNAADAPASSEETTSTVAAGEGGAPTATLAPAGAPIDLGALAASVAAGVGSPEAGEPAPTGGGGVGTTGTTTAASGGGGGGGTTGTTGTPAATGTGPGASNTVDETPPAGGSGSPRPSIAATAQECAALNQLLAIVDHPDLRQLKAQTGC